MVVSIWCVAAYSSGADSVLEARGPHSDEMRRIVPESGKLEDLGHPPALLARYSKVEMMDWAHPP